MTEKVKTVVECYFLVPDFKSRGHPTRETLMQVDEWDKEWFNILLLLLLN